MSQKDTFIHLVAGGVGGTAGAIATCPLEVVKTRLQSSYAHFTPHHKPPPSNPFMPPNLGGPEGGGSSGGGKSPRREQRLRFSTCSSCRAAHLFAIADSGQVGPGRTRSMGVMQCLRYIVEKEGPTALFKGLGPNLVGVAPSRAIYFSSYSKAKAFFNSMLTPDSPIVHIFSAATAGFVACTFTNPIWFVKTRLQLDQQHAGKKLSTTQCIKRIYQQGGILGFYKGITASYYGISETVIHFVIYEAIKAKLQEYRTRRTNGNGNLKSSRDFFEFMFAGAVSKTIASTAAYPHEVARTRLREEGNKYKGFWQTLATVLREEGYRGLYRGLATQLIRQIPNTAIMMSTYEAVVYILTTYTSGDNRDHDSQRYRESAEFYVEETDHVLMEDDGMDPLK